MRLLTLLSLVTIGSVIQPTATTAQDKVDCKKDVEEAAAYINGMWSFKLFKPGAVDIRKEYALHHVLARKAETPAECADVLARFLATLGDGHSALIYFPGLNYTAPEIEIRSQRERLTRVPGEKPKVHAYVVSRDTTVEALATLFPGSEILAVDGKSTEELYRYWEQRVSGSTPQWIDYRIDESLLLGPGGTDVTIQFRQPGGAISEVTVQRPPARTREERQEEWKAAADTMNIAPWKLLEEGWGYIEYKSFAFRSLDQTVRPFDTAIDSLIDAPGLIIDLRGNGGGSTEALARVTGRLIDEKTSMGYFNVRTPGQQTISAVWTSSGLEERPPLWAEPRRPVYEGPLVLLVDRTCFSACEMFAAGLQAAGRALVIGPEATGGGSGGVTPLELPSGALIQFSYAVAWRPDGQIIEGNGVAPEVSVNVTRRDLAARRDRVLERGIQALERGEAPSLSPDGET